MVALKSCSLRSATPVLKNASHFWSLLRSISPCASQAEPRHSPKVATPLSFCCLILRWLTRGRCMTFQCNLKHRELVPQTETFQGFRNLLIHDLKLPVIQELFFLQFLAEFCFQPLSYFFLILSIPILPHPDSFSFLHYDFSIFSVFCSIELIFIYLGAYMVPQSLCHQIYQFLNIALFPHFDDF